MHFTPTSIVIRYVINFWMAKGRALCFTAGVMGKWGPPKMGTQVPIFLGEWGPGVSIFPGEWGPPVWQTIFWESNPAFLYM